VKIEKILEATIFVGQRILDVVTEPPAQLFG
jgi:hypothetical protein